jgi:ubiquinone/menaquinone biosynthesis C-methylase UbiE
LGVYRRVNPSSSAGLPWKLEGDFVTFDWDGYVDAPSIPTLFARHYYETEVIRDLLGGRPGDSGLEFGCGYGRLTPTLASLAKHHIAVDVNPDAVQAAQAAYPRLDFRHVEGARLPFPAGTFDRIVTWTVLQHVRPELIDEVLSELLRVRSERGYLLLCEETRQPGQKTRHSWHRQPSFYEERLTPLRMTYSSYIDEIDRLPGLVSPGRVMLFEP